MVQNLKASLKLSPWPPALLDLLAHLGDSRAGQERTDRNVCPTGQSEDAPVGGTDSGWSSLIPSLG